ncbi:MAG: hypothetical protein HGA42_18875, partial [Nostocales cyanobacterium W4_Combined_metabat2_030]|nr:hypothetical protein [Nostocales cyanobacterium W4_Combined_metabat2_030]
HTNRNVDILDYNPETLFGKGKAALNLLMTYGSKLTLSGGEFFKGMNNRLESVAYATRKEIETLNDYLDSDQPIDEAIFASKNSYAEALNNPPKEIWAEAKKSVLEQEAGPITKKLEEFTQMPGAFGLSAKMLFSFARTTANDIYDLIEYTPANIFISGNVKENSAFTNVISGLKNRRLMEDLRSADPKKIDMAMSRMGIGSFIMYGFSQLSADGYITGSGPSDPKARTNLINQGWQPNSLKISKKWLFPFSDDSNEFNNAQITEIKKLPQTVMGKDESAGYVYISLGGLGRIGSLARIASNFTEYSKYEKQTEKLPAPAGAIIATVSDYMDDSTLVNGALKLLTGLHSVYREPESNKSVNLVKDTTSSTIEMLTKMIPTIGALNFGRQSYDINKRNTAADPNDPAFIQGLEEGLNKLYNQVPGLSNELPMRKNAWGEPVDIEYPLSFIRMSEGKAKPVDRLIQTSQARVGEPQKFLTETIEDEDMQKMSVNVQLNTEEYDELVRIANKDLNLEDRMASVLDSIDKMKSAFNVEDKTLSKKELDNANIELLRAIALELENINEQTYSEARELLYNDSKYSNTLQNRAKREAKNKRATYQLMPGAK